MYKDNKEKYRVHSTVLEDIIESNNRLWHVNMVIGTLHPDNSDMLPVCCYYLKGILHTIYRQNTLIRQGVKEIE